MIELLKSADEDLIFGLAGMLVGVIAILGGISVAITKVVGSNRRKMQLDEMDATLKMEMIQRGMSADEIATVLKARSGGSKNVNLNLNGMSYGCGRRPEFAKQHESVRGT